MNEQLIVGEQLINYEEFGAGQAGPVMVFLHGWRSSGEVWKNLAASLIKDVKAHCFLIDLPGFGASPAPFKTWGIGDYADAVRSFLAKKKLKNVILIGHSFGGRIGIKLTSTPVEAISKLILIDAAGVPLPEARKKIFEFFAKMVSPIFKIKSLGDTRKKIYELIGAGDYVATPDLNEIFKLVVSEDLTPLLPNIKVPTLLVWGESDEVTPLKMGHLFKNKIAGSKLVVIKNAGHFSFVDKPAEVFNAIKNWILL